MFSVWVNEQCQDSGTGSEEELTAGAAKCSATNTPQNDVASKTRGNRGADNHNDVLYSVRRVSTLANRHYKAQYSPFRKGTFTEGDKIFISIYRVS